VDGTDQTLVLKKIPCPSQRTFFQKLCFSFLQEILVGAHCGDMKKSASNEMLTQVARWLRG